MSSKDDLTSILKELAVIENDLTAALTRDNNSYKITFVFVISTIAARPRHS